jgi:hypothetical protein
VIENLSMMQCDSRRNGIDAIWIVVAWAPMSCESFAKRRSDRELVYRAGAARELDALLLFDLE